MNRKRIFCTMFLAAVCAAAFQAQAGDEVDGVTIKGGTVYAIRGEQLEALTNNLELPFDVEMITNGNFTVANGTERRLEEGQIIRRDGWLVGPDGSVQPVFDHLAVKEGRALVVRDGQAAALTQRMVCTNHLSLAPDGECRYPDGKTLRLRDGQLLRLDGSSVPAKDTITLRGGHVVVQKDGKLLTLSPGQIMGMNDGTHVYGDGSIQRMNGPTTKLREGQTILVDGAIMRR